MSTDRMPILDHGYIQFIESWGSDERIIESARISTGKGFLGWGPKHDGICSNRDAHDGTCICGGIPGDEKLLRFMWDNHHGTPFEVAGMTIEVQAPIMVFREWHRHRTQSYNERSARYTPLADVNYMPTTDRLLMGSDGKNRQAGTIAGADTLDLDSALEWQAELADVYDHAERVYQSGLRRGVPKELARLPVPVGRYSTMRATANLRNWLGFATLRSTAKNSAAQWEIRQFTDVLCDVVLTEHFPRTMALFGEKR